MINSEFGDYVADKRKEAGITLRAMADKLNLSPAYWSDIEKGRRNPPNIEKIEEIAALLKLSVEETDHMIDLASEDRNEIPMDLPQYIKESDLAKIALRKARKNISEGKTDITNKAWEEFIKALDNK